MRNVLVSDDGAAQQAGTEVLAAGGNAIDAVVAAMLAGATRVTPAALLGSGVVLVAGAGVGAHFVDGRARAPGLGERRPSAPVSPPHEWRASVPGILEAVLTAHNRFGSLALGTLTRAAAVAVREATDDTLARARVALLEALPRTGLSALARLGVVQATLEAAGPTAGGVITRDDLAPTTSPVRALVEIPADDHHVLRAPEDPIPRFAPPPLPSVPVSAALCADMHGVTACALWAHAPEALALGDTGLSLAALSNAPTKGVTRRRPGSPLPMPIPAAIVRHQGRAWAGVATPGDGDVESVREGYLRARLEAAGIAYEPERPAGGHARGVFLWVLHEAGGEVRAASESFVR